MPSKVVLKILHYIILSLYLAINLLKSLAKFDICYICVFFNIYFGRCCVSLLSRFNRDVLILYNSSKIEIFKKFLTFFIKNLFEIKRYISVT